MPSSLALSMTATWLSENSKPKGSGSYRVSGVYSPDGRRVPFDEIVPGGLVQVMEFRAIEADADAEDYRDKTTTFILAGVQIDYESKAADLLPEQGAGEFERQTALINYYAGR